ncbi:pimeloyl-ACP methyl ester carboxylesterase [Hephaestia caeni]|uniref:Pimeloyl-ACP methyl ester carboxylesterase n=2 Tax=Hephaestia caeni TaxID=645617 RepID=A0A397PAS9_9SPHN|nr:pimeloyl-ACP methyl ester carboxylesterase [Hephaestia caeni]
MPDERSDWQATRSFANAFREDQVQLGEVSLYLTDWGPRDTRPIVLIHGFNVQSHTWDPIAQTLSARRRVICPDLRGHGRSDWAKSGYYMNSFARDLIALFDHLGIVECDLVGHSLGARVAVAIAAEWTGRVHRLVMSDGGPEMARKGMARGSRKAKERLARTNFASREAALAFYEQAHPEWQAIFRTLHAEHQLRHNWAGQLVERADPELLWAALAAGLRDNEYLWECVNRLQCPALLLWGKTSPYFNETLIAEYHERFGDALSDICCETGHYIPREQPDLFCRLVEDFLR